MDFKQGSQITGLPVTLNRQQLAQKIARHNQKIANIKVWW